MSFVSKKDVLSKRVLLAVVAAGFFGSFSIHSSALAEYRGDLPDGELINGVYIIKAPVNAPYIEVNNGTKLLLDGGGTVSGSKIGNDFKATSISNAGTVLTARNVAFSGQVTVDNSSVLNLLDGCGITSKVVDGAAGNPSNILIARERSKVVFNSAEKTTSIKGHVNIVGSELHTRGAVRIDGAIIADDGAFISLNEGLLKAGGSVNGKRHTNSELALALDNKSILYANNVDFKGEIIVNSGSRVVLNGGNLSAGNMFKDNGDYDCKTEIGVDGVDSYFEINGVTIETNLGAFDGGSIVINGGGVIAEDGIYAGAREEREPEFKAKSEIVLNGNPNNKFICKEFIIADHDSKIYINGGMLEDNNFRNHLSYTESNNGSNSNENTTTGQVIHKSDANGIVLDKNGVISTMSGQIFTTAACDADGGNLRSNSGKIHDDVNNAVEFKGGTLQLNDAKYTLDYVKQASGNLKSADSGTTKLVMTGTLVNYNDVYVDQIAKDELSDIEFDNLTAKTTGNLVVGSNTATADASTQNVNNGFSVGKLELAADSNNVAITDNKEVTLGGTKGGDVVSVEGDTNANVNVVVGNNTSGSGSQGTLNIGNSSVGEDVNLKLNGNVTVNKSSTLNTNGKVNITDGVSLSDATLNAAVGSVSTNKLEVGGNSNLLGDAEADDLTLSNNASAGNNVLNIGNDSGSGTLTIKNADLNGGTLFLDPEWKPGGTINDASGLAVTEATTLTGNYVVGRNSYLSLGADLATAKAVFAKTEETWGENDITAAAYIDSKVDVSTGSLVVNGSLTTAPSSYTNGSVVFADKSLLMVNGTNIQSQTAISGVSSATIDEGSKLYIDNAQEGVVYKISDSNLTAWSEENIFSNNKLLKFNIIVGSGFSLSTSNISLAEAYGAAIITPHVFDAAMAAGGKANEFVNNAANAHNNGTEAAQISAFNSAAAMSELAGVEHGTFAASNLFTDAVAER